MLTRRAMLFGAAAVGAIGVPGVADAREPGELVRIERTFEGVRRTAWLWIPDTIAPGATAPLAMVLHGRNQDARGAYQSWGWANSLARAGWFGLFPNTGKFNQIDPEDADLDYLAFVHAEALDLVAADPARNYLVGFSGGGRKTYQLAARASQRFAAIAPVAATVGEVADDEWQPETWDAEPLSILHLHGARDTKVPVEGGESQAGPTVGMWEGLEHWASYLGAAEAPPPDVPGAPPGAEERHWQSRSGHVVLGIIDPQLGHAWPGWGNEVILDFFDRVPIRA